ncbi:MAG: hypothetical protein K6E78_00925 [Treponema sp.]|nr:hypothetical protein [Treponema sp.]
MTNIFLGIIIAFFTAALVLQIIGNLKEIRLMTLITKPFLLPLISAFYILIIKNYLPDSRFLLIYGQLSLTLAFAGNIFFIFSKNWTKIAGSLSYMLSLVSALFITFPSFKLFTPPIFLSILFFLVFFSGLTLVYIFVIKEKSLLLTILYFAFFSIDSVYLYSTLITCAGEKKLYSVILLISAILISGAGYFMTKKEAQKKSLYNFLSITIASVSYALLQGACILMQAL